MIDDLNGYMAALRDPCYHLPDGTYILPPYERVNQYIVNKNEPVSQVSTLGRTPVYLVEE